MVDNMSSRLIVGEGKAIRLEDLPADAWQYLAGGEKLGTLAKACKQVAWLRRAIGIRKSMVGAMPFQIQNLAGDVVDESKSYVNAVKFLPNPKRLFRQVDESLVKYGAAYLFHKRNLVRTLDLEFKVVSSIKPKFSAEKGLIGFTRTIKGQPKPFDVEDFVYFWPEDADVEIGAPKSSDAEAALQSAEVIIQMDSFVAGFFKRGAIKATLLGVSGNTKEPERLRLKAWWQRMISGKPWETEVINSDKIQPTIIGEGLESLSNDTLTKERRQDISTAIGVPETILFGGAANFATAQQDYKNLYTTTVIPDCEFISEALNQQVMIPNGYQLMFLPETLDVFQSEETDRASAYAMYVRSGMPPSVAAQMLGLELPQGTDYDQLDEFATDYLSRSLALRGFGNEPTGTVSQSSSQNPDDLKALERKALKRLKQGKSLEELAFETDQVDADNLEMVLTGLRSCKSGEQVRYWMSEAREWLIA